VDHVHPAGQGDDLTHLAPGDRERVDLVPPRTRRVDAPQEDRDREEPDEHLGRRTPRAVGVGAPRGTDHDMPR